MSLTRDQILAAPLPREEVQTPEWGGSVFVRTLTAGEVSALSRAMQTHAAKPAIGVILAFTLCDEQGTPLFSEADIDAINAQSSAPVLRAIEASERLNKFSPKDVDNAEKNFDASREGSSSTGSPLTADISSETSKSESAPPS